MKQIILLLLFLTTLSVKGQNFLTPVFVHNNVNYTVLHSQNASSMLIHNASNSQGTTAPVLYRKRKMNYEQLKRDIVNTIKSMITPTQVVLLQTEKPMSINLLVDATGKINIVGHFYISYNSCLQPADIYNIEIALKNIIMQFIDGLPPEAGQLGSVGIPSKMFR